MMKANMWDPMSFTCLIPGALKVEEVGILFIFGGLGRNCKVANHLLWILAWLYI